MQPANTRTKAKIPFRVLLIKPSHYDDDGYVIQWWRSSLPSNSLATVYAIIQDCAERQCLGEDIDIRLEALDETNTRIRPQRLIRELRKDPGYCMIGFVGVQTNQFPRALDLAKPFRDAGLPVVIGGFHVSGCLSMLDSMPPELKQAQAMGCSLYAGELEGRLETLLQDVVHDRLQPLYNYMHELPGLDGAPVPFLPAERIKRTLGKRGSFDAGRGCPFLCSFCTIINVQGRKSRFRKADDLERLVRANSAQGIQNYFVTDDNFARNRNWEELLDRLIALRENEGIEVRLVLQVDTMAHKVPGFIEKCGRAGADRVFIGLENINPDSLKTARKGQNRITEYREMLQAWHQVGALTYAGYILGFPGDTPETIRRDIGIIKRELAIDILEFFILTPLPGSQDHQQLVKAGVDLDPDMNNYDLQHVCTDHSDMSRQEWQAIYREAWDLYYSDEHVETVLRRARTWGYDTGWMMGKLFAFHAPILYEHMHPLEGGLIRYKFRKDRRPGFPLESPLRFYPRMAWEYLSKYTGVWRMHRRYARIRAKVDRDASSRHFSDTATAPVGGQQGESLDLFNVTESARKYVDKSRNWGKKRSKQAPGTS